MGTLKPEDVVFCARCDSRFRDDEKQIPLDEDGLTIVCVWCVEELKRTRR